jgi:hypothetical protein
MTFEFTCAGCLYSYPTPARHQALVDENSTVYDVCKDCSALLAIHPPYEKHNAFMQIRRAAVDRIIKVHMENRRGRAAAALRSP